MEDKTFVLLEKMYGEMQNLKNEMQEGFKKNDKRFAELENKMDRKFVHLENKVDQNVKILHDGYKLSYEKLTSIEDNIEELSTKVDNQDVEIRVVKKVVGK